MARNTRADHNGAFRSEFDKNKKIIMATQTNCALCGLPVDKTIKWPDPMSATIDHVIPVQKGGHPSDLQNLQLAHFWCNRQKSDKVMASRRKVVEEDNNVDNRNLPLSRRWEDFVPEA